MANSVIKRSGKFFIGSLEIRIENGKYKGYTWSSEKPITKLSDVKEASSYKTLAKWLKEKNLNPNLKEKILKETSMESIYLLDKPIDPTPEEFEAYWWSNINKQCINCIKKCKQSSKVIIVKCPQRTIKK